MHRHTLVGIVAALAIAAVPVTGAAQAKPDPQKPEAPKAPAVSVVGKWNVSVAGPNGNVESTLDLKADPKDAKKLTGSIASQMGEAPITGEFAESKLSFGFSMDAGGQQLNVTASAVLQKDGSLAGTMSFGQGDLTWTAIRAK